MHFGKIHFGNQRLKAVGQSLQKIYITGVGARDANAFKKETYH